MLITYTPAPETTTILASEIKTDMVVYNSLFERFVVVDVKHRKEYTTIRFVTEDEWIVFCMRVKNDTPFRRPIQ